MKQYLRNLIERVLIVRPDATIQDFRNLVPELRLKSDDEIERLVTPARDKRAKEGG